MVSCEELRQAQADLNCMLVRHFDLNCLASVDYVGASKPEPIIDANFTTAILLGCSRTSLSK